MSKPEPTSHDFTCSRCAQRVGGIFTNEPEKLLETLGWMFAHGKLFCGATCVAWFNTLKGDENGKPLVAVASVKDRAYQRAKEAARPSTTARASK